MSLMLDEDQLPPVIHTGGRCKCCGYMVAPTHDSVDCAFATAGERDALRTLVHDLLRWGVLEGKGTASARFGELKAKAVTLRAIEVRA